MCALGRPTSSFTGVRVPSLSISCAVSGGSFPRRCLRKSSTESTRNWSPMPYPFTFIITLIFYRLHFFPFSPRQFDPLYWIDMGGAAISALAGSLLLLRANAWPILGPYIPFLKGITLFFWAAATWWIPFLVALMVWRYVVRKDKLRYEPPLWGIVFPLGMYAAATFELIRAERLAFLGPLSRIFMFAALAAWVFTFFGFLWHLITAGFCKKQRVSRT